MKNEEKLIDQDTLKYHTENDLREIFNQLPDLGEPNNEILKSAIRLGYLEGVHRGLHLIMQAIDDDKPTEL